MAAVQFRSGLPEQVNSLTDRLVLAIDLGFSKEEKSCGVAWRDSTGQPQSKGFRFGECIKEVAGLLEGHSKVVLIIEAPLSGMFTSIGNPIERGEFERNDPGSSSKAQRYWYVGAGGAMCLAVVFFLRKLLAELRQLSDEAQPIEIVLYEGFITFKPEATEHVSDARLLLDCFLGTQARRVFPVEASKEQTIVAITDVVAGSDPDSVAPAIIAPGRPRLNQGS